MHKKEITRYLFTSCDNISVNWMIPRNTSVTICQQLERSLKSFQMQYKNNVIFLCLSKEIRGFYIFIFVFRNIHKIICLNKLHFWKSFFVETMLIDFSRCNVRLCSYNVIMEKITQTFNLDYSSTIANIRKRNRSQLNVLCTYPPKSFIQMKIL